MIFAEDHPVKQVECPDKSLRQLGVNASQCEDWWVPSYPESCDATVTDLLSCREAWYLDPCAANAPPACDWMESCSMGHPFV